MVSSSLAPKWPILVHFCGMDHQKSFFLLILAPFVWEAVEASQYYFFENWLIKTKCHNLLNRPPKIWNWKSQSVHLSEPIYFVHFNVRHPVPNISISHYLFIIQNEACVYFLMDLFGFWVPSSWMWRWNQRKNEIFCGRKRLESTVQKICSKVSILRNFCNNQSNNQKFWDCCLLHWLGEILNY